MYKNSTNYYYHYYYYIFLLYPLQLLGVILGLTGEAVPRMAGYCTLPRGSGTSSLPNLVQVTPSDMLPRVRHDRYYNYDFQSSMNPSDFKC